MISFAAACGGTSDPFVTGLIDRTKPDGDRVTEYLGVKRTTVGIDASWVVETDMTWDRYAEWVTRRLSPGFETVGSGATSLTLRKSFEADTYIILFEGISGRGRPGVRVTVVGRPH